MSYTHISETTHKAAKRHRCIWCGERVLPGELYVRVAGVFEGDFQSDCFHLECRVAAVAHFQEVDEEFCPHENERPPSPATLEWESWDCSVFTRRAQTMAVCSTCGNKRCPKATYDRLPCSGSNASGQLG